MQWSTRSKKEICLKYITLSIIFILSSSIKMCEGCMVIKNSFLPSYYATWILLLILHTCTLFSCKGGIGEMNLKDWLSVTLKSFYLWKFHWSVNSWVSLTVTLERNSCLFWKPKKRSMCPFFKSKNLEIKWF